MQNTAKVPRKADGSRPARRPLFDDELADQPLGKAQSEGVELLGPMGCCPRLPRPSWNGPWLNSRNGATAKTVLTDVGAVDLTVPRDRNGSFEPQIVRKGQTRLEGFNDRIIALYARGMTARDIRAHLREIV
jgi:putative transposase